MTGTGRPGATPTIRLTTAAGKVRASVKPTVRRTITVGRFSGTLRKDGVKVSAKPGNRLTSSALTGSDTVVANTLVLVAGTGTGSIGVTCRPDSRWATQVNGSSDTNQGSTETGVVEVTGQTLATGDKVLVGCMDTNGFGQRFMGTVG